LQVEVATITFETAITTSDLVPFFEIFGLCIVCQHNHADSGIGIIITVTVGH